ncbi:MAG: RNA polymerase sigma factor [Elusimicrobiales bacterium]
MMDERVLDNCLRGDEAAYEELLNIHKNRIFSFILRFAAAPEDAEDIAQTVFLKVFANLASYDRRRPFMTWLFAIAHNCCMDHLRKKRPEQLSLDDEERPLEIEDPSSSTEAAAARNFEHEEAEALLARLPPLYREALLLQYREGMGCSEIAAVLGVPEGTVKARLFRARALLMKKMQPAGTGGRIT